ncbi:hypothetical protein [Oryza sativa Japonica Group]|uniref:Uncharacterized protein n=1 Tax=Oryza sativa subsp. japonica TaxID=39947 RepID=Q5JL29_ORYSJ|nr:hypothetical protein [Oryza sativa Japonica Group]
MFPEGSRLLVFYNLDSLFIFYNRSSFLLSLFHIHSLSCLIHREKEVATSGRYLCGKHVLHRDNTTRRRRWPSAGISAASTSCTARTTFASSVNGNHMY